MWSFVGPDTRSWDLWGELSIRVEFLHLFEYAEMKIEIHRNATRVNFPRIGKPVQHRASVDVLGVGMSPVFSAFPKLMIAFISIIHQKRNPSLQNPDL